MIISYKAKATTVDGRELEHDTMNLNEAKRWCDRWVDDGRLNVRVTVLSSDTVWGEQTARTYRWIQGVKQLGGELR
jgi:hypothetical protein